MTEASPPLTDSRLEILNAAIEERRHRPDALIALLHKVQDLYGFLDLPLLWHVARVLKLPPSRVRGVATFYHLFRLKPPAEHKCIVCLGTACFVNGGQKLLEAFEEAARIRPGQTTQDGRISLAISRCVGACGMAPVVVLDDLTVGQAIPESFTGRVREWMHGS